MRDSIRTLLGLGITIGLSDREKFISEVSEVINHYQTDPTKGDKWAHGLVDYLEQMKNNMNMESAIKNAISQESLPDKDNIEDLTKAIKELTNELKRSKEK